jgi:hypothetical protein
MTSVSYEAGLGQTDFQITFPYISDAHIQVFVDGAGTTDFTISSEGLMSLDAMVHTILAGDVINIVRSTPTADLIATFASPSSVRSGEILTGFRQLLYIAQEILAVSLTGLLKSLSGTRWNAESLVLENLGEPVSGDHATTKAYVDNLAAQSGVLPALTTDDLGQGIRIRSDGGFPSYVVGPISGAAVTYKIPQTGIDDGAQIIFPNGNGLTGTWISHVSTKMPLGIESTSGEPTYGTYAVDLGTDMVIPRGSYIIEALGSVRSFTRTVNQNVCTVSAALVTSTGTVLDVHPIAKLGRSGGGLNRIPPIEPYPASAFISLKANVTFLATTRVNLRMSGNTSCDDHVADTPWRVTFTEVVN